MTRRSLLTGIGGAAAGGVGWALSPASATTRSRLSGQAAQRTLEAPPQAGAWVELDRAAAAANLAAVRAQAGGRPVMGVVKANAYGHGLVPMARLLADAGVDAFMVITVDEALAVRAAGIRLPVINWGPFDPGAAGELVREEIEQTVYTAGAVAGMAAAARRVGRSGRVHLVLDTGLGRVGVPFEAAGAVIEAIGAAVDEGTLELAGTATALTEDPDFDRVQLERLGGVCDRIASAGTDVGVRHAAASTEVIDLPAAHLDMVRPGITLYGHYPNDRSRTERPIELTPVLSLRARVAYVKTLQAGESIGYHRAWVAERATTVATLPIGHSEGYPAEALAAGGWVEIDGHACPLVGGITSDHLEVAIPAAATVRIGGVATLIAAGAGGAGSETANGAPTSPTAVQVGEWGGAGVYGALMHVSPLLPRVIT